MESTPEGSHPHLTGGGVGDFDFRAFGNGLAGSGGHDHPFHQHTNAAQILEIAGGDSDYSSLYTSIPGWKDTINVPRMGSVLMLVPARDYTGRTVFHCHIVEHEDIGMMGIWDLV